MRGCTSPNAGPAVLSASIAPANATSPQLRDDEDALTAAIVGLARSFGRYGYRRITGLLQMAGWQVNAKRVQRIWRAEGLKVPKRQPKRGRLWLADGSCIRLRPEHRNHVWAYDFVTETTHDGRKLRLLTVVDEYTRECLAIRVARRMTSHDVLYALADLFLEYGIPEHIRSDNGPEFVAKAVREWLADLGVTTSVHRTRLTLGERLHRIVQRQAAETSS